ncbi:hypothetical protein F5Y14DRAFT_15979 [Nemania sp. NC0429]|nr:hypothetical protein F5Y14DRAFT_15979 [Nemania sp. NC0429]
MDGVHVAGSPAPGPLRGKVGGLRKGLGRGISKKNARKNAAAPKRGGGRPRGRGRNKTYEDPRVQAAYERQKVLRDLYSEVASAIKPVLEDLADRNVKNLIDNPTAHTEVPEYDILQRQLDERLDETLRAAEREFSTRAAIATREYQLHTAATEKKFIEGYDYAVDEFFNGSLKRAILLAELGHKEVDINLPDTTYTFVEKPDEVLDQQGPWVAFRDGIKVPYPYLLDQNKKTAAAAAKVQVGKGRPPAKRRAEDQPDGQPDFKKSTGPSGLTRPDNGDEASTPQPRHIKGLLSAEAGTEKEAESNAASPSPESDPKTEVPRGRKDLPDLPNGASEPDKWGVRTVIRRGPRANNRLILPPLFTFADEEIGFRDSTNDSSKKATRGTRGRFLDNPNSRNFHIDRTIVTYDCLDYEDDALDSNLVQKHNIHPKYGLFLPDSRNESEPPKIPVSGSNPIVIATPSGGTLHASRSVRGYNMDATLREDARKDRVSLILTQYCKVTGIESEEITTDEMRERERERQRNVTVQPPATSEDKDEQPADEGLDTADAEADESVARETVNRLLNAAVSLENERPNYPPSSQRLSRPYDAVRDVFTNAEPTPPPPMPPIEIDTYQLSYLADVSEQVSLQREAQFDPTLDHRLEPQVEYRPDYQFEHYHSAQYEYRPEYMPDQRPVHYLEHRLDQSELSAMGDSMIDPRLLGPPNPVPPPPNNFLQTALNPPQTLAHIAPAPPQGIEPPAPASVGRIPFTNQGGGKPSPVLPPLRPSRREKAIDSTHQPPPTLVQQTPDFGPTLGMIQSNSGSFFPPAPSRPYHQGYTIVEQNPMMGVPFGMSSGNLVSSQTHLGPSHRLSYQPPSPTMSGHAQIAAMPMHMSHGSSVSPPGSSMGLRSPTGPPGSRHRASISSGSNGPNNAKYRKIAAAPIPHNRPWQQNGGAELRLAHYDHKEAIKDYRANEPPPRTGPTTIRGWNVNNGSKGRKGLKKEDSEEKDSPSITTFINKWNPSEKTIG